MTVKSNCFFMEFRCYGSHLTSSRVRQIYSPPDSSNIQTYCVSGDEAPTIYRIVVPRVLSKTVFLIPQRFALVFAFPKMVANMHAKVNWMCSAPIAGFEELRHRKHLISTAFIGQRAVERPFSGLKPHGTPIHS